MVRILQTSLEYSPVLEFWLIHYQGNQPLQNKMYILILLGIKPMIIVTLQLNIMPFYLYFDFMNLKKTVLRLRSYKLGDLGILRDLTLISNSVTNIVDSQKSQ